MTVNGIRQPALQIGRTKIVAIRSGALNRAWASHRHSNASRRNRHLRLLHDHLLFAIREREGTSPSASIRLRPVTLDLRPKVRKRIDDKTPTLSAFRTGMKSSVSRAYQCRNDQLRMLVASDDPAQLWQALGPLEPTLRTVEAALSKRSATGQRSG